MKSKERFESLTEKQTEVLGWCAIGKTEGHNRSTIEALLRKGYLDFSQPRQCVDPMKHLWVETDTVVVPLDVHMRWCQWCADNERVPVKKRK